jgi:hypothetical protein
MHDNYYQSEFWRTATTPSSNNLFYVSFIQTACLWRSSICHHLKQLTESAIILPEKEGRNIKYMLNNDVIDEYIGFLQGLKK